MMSSVTAFLFHAALQIPLVALAAWLAARMLRSAPARQQHLVWVAALVLSLALPALSLWPRSVPRAVAAAPASAPRVAVAQRPLETLLRSTQEQPAFQGAAQVLVIAYGAFLMWRALALLVAWRRTRAIVRSGSAVADVIAPVPVLASLHIDTPLTVGALRPVIVLPKALLDEIEEDALRALIGHELAHIRRRDFALNLLLELVALPIAFHPAVWLMKRRLVLTRELACDEEVAPALVPSRIYARALLDIAAFSCGAAGPAVSLTMAGSHFEQRIRRLIGPARAKTSRIVLLASWIALGATAFGAAAMAVRPQRHAPVNPAILAADAETRAAMACAAGRARDKSAIPTLLAILGDEAPIAESRCYQETTWSPALQSIDHPSPGEQAALALASISRPAVPDLVAMLNDRSPAVRRNAAWAIGEARGGWLVDRHEALAPLISLLDDPDPTVRRAAAFGLSELKNQAAVAPLTARLKDEDGGVREMAALALSEIHDARFLPHF